MSKFISVYISSIPLLYSKFLYSTTNLTTRDHRRKASSTTTYIRTTTTAQGSSFPMQSFAYVPSGKNSKQRESQGMHDYDS